MPTPTQIAEKFEREWLASKGTAILNYAAAAPNWYDRMVAARQSMIDNFAVALAVGGKWDTNILPYATNYQRLSDSYESSLNNITSLSDAKLLKVAEDAALKQHLGEQVEEVYTLLFNSGSGEVTVPAIRREAVYALLIQAINSQQGKFTTVSTPAQILVGITEYLTDVLQFENKA